MESLRVCLLPNKSRSLIPENIEWVVRPEWWTSPEARPVRAIRSAISATDFSEGSPGGFTILGYRGDGMVSPLQQFPDSTNLSKTIQMSTNGLDCKFKIWKINSKDHGDKLEVTKVNRFTFYNLTTLQTEIIQFDKTPVRNIVNCSRPNVWSANIAEYGNKCCPGL